MVERECGDFVCVCSDCMMENFMSLIYPWCQRLLQLGDSAGLDGHHVVLGQHMMSLESVFQSAEETQQQALPRL